MMEGIRFWCSARHVIAIKWHPNQGQKKGKEQQRAVLRAGGKGVAVVVLSLLGPSLLTFDLGRMPGLDLTLP